MSNKVLRPCGTCHKYLSRVTSTQQKILIDIIIHPEIIKQILYSERQWCGICKEEVIAKDEKSLPFTEYDINTFMTVILLRFKCRASFSNIATVLSVFGLTVSKSVVSNILKQAKTYLNGKYQDLIQAVRDGEIMYNDETGWMIRGQRAWMWIMANNDITIHHAAESRGKAHAEELYGNSQTPTPCMMVMEDTPMPYHMINTSTAGRISSVMLMKKRISFQTTMQQSFSENSW